MINLIDTSKVLSEFNLLIKEDNLLLNYKFNDPFLLMFLRCCHFDVNQALQRLKFYILKVKQNPKAFRFTNNLRNFLEDEIYILSPLNTSEGGLMFSIAGNLNSNKFSADDMARVLAILTAIDENIQLNGYQLIVDAKGMSMYHYWKIGLKKSIFIAELTHEALPADLKLSHVINSNKFFETAFHTVKRFMPSKWSETTVIHKSLSDLHQKISPQVLPASFGGKNDQKYSTDELMNKIEKIRPILEPIWNQFK